MARYFVTRTLSPLTAGQMDAVGKQVKTVCAEMGMEWIRSHLTADGKHSFCEFEAPSTEACREHAAKAGLPVDDVIPLGMETGLRTF